MTIPNDGVLPSFHGAAVAQQTERCLNVRYRAAGCTQCVALCPVDALALADGKPILKGERCIKCGLCLQGCPTEVFTQPDVAEIQLIRTVEQLPHQPIMLVCALHPTPQSTTAPVNTIVQHRRCLAALSVAQLLALSQDGERTLWLDDSPCPTCPLNTAHALLQASVTTANTLLQTFDHSATLFLQSVYADQLTNAATRYPLIDSGNPPVSRRGLLAALGRAVKMQREPTTPAPSPAADNRPQPVHARLPQHIPTVRTALQERMRQWAQTDQKELNVTALPFADVQVDPALCSACGLCARFCPTGALRFTAEDKQFRLSFQPALCVDCPICTIACPEKAIRMSDTLSTDALLTNEWLLLLEGGFTPCGQCRVPTADHANTQNAAPCYACRQGAGVVQPLHDGAGLMADLLTRSAKVEKL